MSNRLARKLTLLAFSTCLFVPSVTMAADDEYICEARQNSKSELPILSESCPVGKGLWGVKPKSEEGLFWIQCGVFSKPLTVSKAQRIYKEISLDVWVKKEGGNYRCLIGPYETFSLAREELAKVKRIPSYEQAFIRDASTPSAPEKKMTKPAVTPSVPAVGASVPAAAAVKPATAEKEADKASKLEGGADVGDTIVARRDAKIGEKYFAIPFLMDGDEQFYMEYGIAWNRVSYDKAEQICQSQGMRLPNTDEWKLLIDSKVMIDKQWPLHLPYWGEERQGLFTSGKVTQLTGTSLLNVICVR